ncbi:MAG: DUF4147 domain-containing protein [Pseudomonadota bacterium]
MSDPKETLQAIWWAGVTAVRGFEAVSLALDAGVDPPAAILATGKAAVSMAEAACARFPGTPCLVCTKYDHAAEANLPTHAKVIEAAHPVPDAQSIAAGRAALELVSAMDPGSHLLLLVSGGASALLEVPKGDLTLEDLAAENARLLSEGLDIHAMNRRRKELSEIKGGGLLSAFQGARVSVLAISDVEGDDIGVIGSGIGAAPEAASFAYDARIVASNAIARAAAAAEAGRRGIPVLSSDETLYEDVGDAAQRISAALDGAPGLRIWGGEPTVILPQNPGDGGRNQALSLAVARDIAGRDGLSVLIAGTDGSDGPTGAAGGLVDGSTWTPDAAGYLARADSGSFLNTRGARFVTGPTGTNVMDLALALQG